MKNVKQLIAVTAMLLCGTSAAYAVTVSPTATIADNYIGARYYDSSGNGVRDSTYDVAGGSDYQIHSMEVTRTVDAGRTYLDVQVNTNFAGKAGAYHYGDLFLTDVANYDPYVGYLDAGISNGYSPDSRFGTADLGQNTRWLYAFDVDYGSTSRADNTSGVNHTGALVDIDQNQYAQDTTTAREYPSDSGNGYRPDQIVMANKEGTENGYWSVTNGDYVSFHIDISGTSLASAGQLALRWAMTCGNDIIEGIASFPNSGATVPEPAAYMLMLAGLAGLGFSRRRKTAKVMTA